MTGPSPLAASTLTGPSLLAAAAAVTVVVEVAFLTLLGYRRPVFLLMCALINLTSNLALNLILIQAPTHWRGGVLPVLELAVVAAEWAVLRLVVAGPVPPPVRSRTSLNLALAVLAANALSFTIGLIWF